MREVVPDQATKDSFKAFAAALVTELNARHADLVRNPNVTVAYHDNYEAHVAVTANGDMPYRGVLTALRDEIRAPDDAYTYNVAMQFEHTSGRWEIFSAADIEVEEILSDGTRKKVQMNIVTPSRFLYQCL